MSKNDIINKIETQQFNKFPEFSSGDTVEVSVKVKEGKRERVPPSFEIESHLATKPRARTNKTISQLDSPPQLRYIV